MLDVCPPAADRGAGLMGFTTPNLPKVEPESFLAQPLMDRIKTLVLKWVDYGYGVPRMVHLI